MFVKLCQFQLVPVRSPFVEGSKLNFCKQAANSIDEAPGSLWVRNTRQQALLWLTACGALRVSAHAYDAQLVSYIQNKPSCRGPSSLPLQRVSDQKFKSTKLCMIDRRSCQRSWAVATRIMEAVWAMIQVPFQVWDPALLGIFGTRCGERKRMSLIEVGSRDQFGCWLFFGGLRFWCFQLLVFGVVFLCFGLGRALLFHSFCSLSNRWVPRPRQFSKMLLIVYVFSFFFMINCVLLVFFSHSHIPNDFFQHVFLCK